MLVVFFVFVTAFLSFNVQAAPSIVQSGAGFFMLAPTQITQSGMYKLSQDILLAPLPLRPIMLFLI